MNIIFAQCFASYAAGEVLSEGLAMMGLGEWIYKSHIAATGTHRYRNAFVQME